MARKTIPLLGQYGIISDQPSQELPPNAWSSGENMRFHGGLMERFSGQEQVFTAPSVTPYFIAPYQTATKRYWIHSGIASTFADDGTTRTDITGTAFTGTQDNRFSGGVLNGIFGMTNGVDVPVYWDGVTTNNLTTLPGWDATERCAVLVPFKYYWVALDITKGVGTTPVNYPYMVKWSGAALPGANPTTWDETSVTNEAGENDVGETGDLLVDGVVLGDALILYKQSTRYAVRQTFDSRIFSFQKLPGFGGALAKGCVADTPIGHVVLTSGDVYVHTGGQPTSLCDETVREAIFTGLDSTYGNRCRVVANHSKNEVWICYPETGETSCTRAAVYNWIGKTWSFRDLPNLTYAASGLLELSTAPTIDSISTVIDSYVGVYDADAFSPNNSVLLMTTTAPRIDLADSTGTFAGTAYTSYVERVNLVIDGDTSTVKLWKKIVPRITAAVGTQVLIEAGGSMSAEEAPTWTFSYAYTVGQRPAEAYGFASGIYNSLRITSQDNQPFSMKSMDIEYEIEGEY